MNDLAIINQSNAPEIFTKENGLDPYLQQVRDEIDSFVPDITTDKSRKAIASFAAKIGKSRKHLDDAGKDLVAELKKKPKLIDAERKRMRDTLDAWKVEARKPLTDWEDSEAERKNGILARINAMERLSQVGDLSAWETKQRLTEVVNVKVGDSFHEYQNHAQLIKDEALELLQKSFDKKTQHEKEQVELAELRKQQVEREAKEKEDAIKREAAENARREAEEEANKKIALEKQKAENARIEAERKTTAENAANKRREREAAEREENLQRKIKADKAKADQDIKDAADRAQRVIDEAAQKVLTDKRDEEAARRKREENKSHAMKVNNQSVRCLMRLGEVDRRLAVKIVTAIAKNEIDNVSIKY